MAVESGSKYLHRKVSHCSAGHGFNYDVSITELEYRSFYDIGKFSTKSKSQPILIQVCLPTVSGRRIVSALFLHSETFMTSAKPNNAAIYGLHPH